MPLTKKNKNGYRFIPKRLFSDHQVNKQFRGGSSASALDLDLDAKIQTIAEAAVVAGSFASDVVSISGGITHDPGNGDPITTHYSVRFGAANPTGGTPPIPMHYLNTTSGQLWHYTGGTWVRTNQEDHGDVLYVSPNGNNSTAVKGNSHFPHLTIASAITNSTAGDKIVILEGTFTEDITLSKGLEFILQEGVKLIGTLTITSSNVRVGNRGVIQENEATSAVIISGSVTNVELSGKIVNLGSGTCVETQSDITCKEVYFFSNGSLYIDGGSVNVTPLNCYANIVAGVGASITYYVDAVLEDSNLSFYM